MEERDFTMTLLVDEDGASLRIQDSLSGTCVVDAEIPAKDFCLMLGRMSYVPIKAKTGPLDRVGKRMENKKYSFVIPKELRWGSPDVRDEALRKLGKKHCPDGWESDLYFNSQDSFFDKDGKQYAQTMCRRWVETEAV